MIRIQFVPDIAVVKCHVDSNREDVARHRVHEGLKRHPEWISTTGCDMISLV
jgi:hypothetical protein